jgi:thiamine-monophosphate kinase
VKLSQKGEFGLIELIRRECGKQNKRIMLGIGDDAAIIQTDSAKYSVLTTDALIETVHFNLDYFTFFQLGWRALAANLSDIAAMGGKPVCAVVTLGLNDRISVENVRELYQGMLSLARKFNCTIAGGDIVRSPKFLMISISVLGEVERGRVVTRSGAKIGDLICVTGQLGEAQAGLELLLERRKRKGLRFSSGLTKKHLLPFPSLAESEYLLRKFRLNSMIDISDGLASDLHHICEESQTGAVIYADKIPVSPKAKQASRLLDKDALEFALQGGEEYELLFTLRKKQAAKLLKSAKFKFTVIGEIIPPKRGIWLQKGSRRLKLFPLGYTHF